PLDVNLPEEFSIEAERLNAVVDSVADINDSVVRDGDPVDRIELLWPWPFIDTRERRGVVRLVAVRTPMPLVGAGIRIEHDHSSIPIIICDEDLIGRSVDCNSSCLVHVFCIVAAAGLGVVANLQKKLS